MNGRKLSITERCSICVARALLSSVDLLLLGGNLDILTLDHANSILKVLKKWRWTRGMGCLAAEGGGNVLLKKPKTIFFVTNTQELAEQADTMIVLRDESADNSAGNGADNPVSDAVHDVVSEQ